MILNQHTMKHCVFAKDGALTFDEAVLKTSGNKLIGPDNKPHMSLRDAGTVQIGDLPLTFVEASHGKLEQFCDIILDYKCDKDEEFFENVIFKHIKETEYDQLPAPFSLDGAPPVPFVTQIMLLRVAPPEDADDPDATYVHILKHVYLHKNKIAAQVCINLCRGICHKFVRGNNFRAGLLAANYMMDQMGGFQVRFWTIQAKMQKKHC